MKKLTGLCLGAAGFLLLASSPLHAQDSLQGVELPNPLGIGVTFYHQSQPYQIDELVVDVPGLDQDPLQGLTVDNGTNTFHLRADYWLLPFLNIFALGGIIDSATQIDLSGADIPAPFSLDDLEINMDGAVYGGGLVLAYGWQEWFGTLTYQLTGTNLKETDSSVSAWVLTPTVGMRFKRAAAWVGAMYQQAEEEHSGTMDITGIGDVTYNVKLREAKPWNFLVGGTYGISSHWLVTAQAGLGDRMAALGTVEYRF